MKHYPVKHWKITTPLTDPHFTNGETEARKGQRSATMFAALLGPKFKGKKNFKKIKALIPHLPAGWETGLRVFTARLKDRQESLEQGKAGKRSPQSTSHNQRNPARDLAN